MWFFTPDFSPRKMEKNPVYEKWRKIQYMKNGEKSGIVSPQNAGTWRMNCVVPDAPADYVGRSSRPGKLVELLLAEEGCRMWEARQEEKGNFFIQKWSRPGTRWT